MPLFNSHVLQATRLNWYRDSSEWKPFHHDAAAIKGMSSFPSVMEKVISCGNDRPRGGAPPLTEVLPFFNSTINEHSPGLFCHGVSQNVAVSSCYLVTFCWSITGGTCFNWSCEFPKMNEDTYRVLFIQRTKPSSLTWRWPSPLVWNEKRHLSMPKQRLGNVSL